MKRTAIVLIVMVAAVGQTNAIDTGNDLLTDCGYFVQHGDGGDVAQDNYIRGVFCAGFVRGVLHAYADVRKTGQILQTLNVECTSFVGYERKPYPGSGLPLSAAFVGGYCAPNATMDQLVRIVVKYAKEHPKDLHLPAAFVTRLAFKDAFPCPDPKEGDTP